MNMKYWGVASVAAVVSLSAAQAQVFTISKRAETKSNFSWSGFYVGAQGGDVSSDLKGPLPIFDGANEDLSGLAVGLYAGYNTNFNNSFVLGIDTDVLLLSKKHEYIQRKTKTREEVTKKLGITSVEGAKLGGNNAVHPILSTQVNFTGATSTQVNFTGATRVRVGFSFGRLMPYVAGGVAYAQLQNTAPKLIEEKEQVKPLVSTNTSDKTETMVGYTLGGGIAFAVIHNIVVRAEYRYSDFGKRKLHGDVFVLDNIAEHSYKTNDFRAGIAFKF
ncbi:outer membrane protein [Bartonella sp. A05]|uniref:outer membrane protein n=1 Tax=Bartonella sp. A05 TaxID=2967261 RepID=UPI0022A9849E|nr:outer membrane beta-barrel protein [Bartonella sp. A05]MCZ2203354.1 outer membrane beta-barrel protein [Bartonella sp. A05]